MRLVALLVLCGSAQAGPKCFEGMMKKEQARVVEALDAELRKTGGRVLVPRELELGERSFARGTILPGNLMVVGETQACGGVDPNDVMAIDRKGVVFAPIIKIAAKKTFASIDCGSCDGCGTEPPKITVVVEVPANAKLGEDRTIVVPMAEHFDVKLPAISNVCPPIP